MNIKVGFCEIALILSYFFFPESKTIGIILLIIAILGALCSYAIPWNEKNETTKMVKDANDNLAKSLSEIIEKPKNTHVVKKDPKSFIFENYIDKDKEN